MDDYCQGQGTGHGLISEFLDSLHASSFLMLLRVVWGTYCRVNCGALPKQGPGLNAHHLLFHLSGHSLALGIDRPAGESQTFVSYFL